ncbi:hypothetical protein [Streptomyces albireticuli]|uniref:HTH luxR-type domain-containing protein n=1 Tax=Streptomyces albireticuli TaxID=1940 RepID=A0A2A2D6A2_9ACTN|nr:hypothetical protein [Streptomyces albireticuli]MCD9145979.1 hypothetical protein [Streptomyces albireticuli]MCD9165778.1 hypothetical protein [Streptomyces albireticuli]MCD9195996.1 hypothetical protein [Streptomyces albireticuli]PAU46909.1 hypothetical protein CK936_21670 [Streptomyces albireticuli]
MTAPSTSTPIEAFEFPYGSVLATVLPPREYQALMDSTFLSPQQRIAITLVAVGHTLKSATEAMGIKPTTLASYLASTANELGCHQRVSLLVHSAYSHPDFPTPARIDEPAPTLDTDEWTVLLAHTQGITFQRLSESRGRARSLLTGINQRLMTKLAATSPPHAVRRAWQHGLLPHHGAPAGPGADGRTP